MVRFWLTTIQTLPTRKATDEGYQGVRKKNVSVISIDELELRSHVSEVVRWSVEETLNGLLDAEADTCRTNIIFLKNVPHKMR